MSWSYSKWDYKLFISILVISRETYFSTTALRIVIRIFLSDLISSKTSAIISVLKIILLPCLRAKLRSTLLTTLYWLSYYLAWSNCLHSSIASSSSFLASLKSCVFIVFSVYCSCILSSLNPPSGMSCPNIKNWMFWTTLNFLWKLMMNVLA